MVKRSFDILVSLIVILVSFPLWLLIAVLIKLDSSGPIFYRSFRVGKGERRFRIYKFRTMCVDADMNGPGITRSDDSRITVVGKFLRKMKLDELPQLINVLKGEMSVIGPRPEDPDYVRHYSKKEKQVFSVRPGMASPAFIEFRDEEKILGEFEEGSFEAHYREEILPRKLALDLEYISKRSFWYDLQVFWMAVKAVLQVTDPFQDN
jgi:lipopolysaccharide/colanic/teichoic acid biosynthesis glycosyltransferase